MRKTLLSSTLLIFVTVLMLLTGRVASAGNHLQVESSLKVVKQGDVCLVSVLGPASSKPVFVEFQGGRFPLVFSEQRRTYEGLIGIDMNTRPSTYEMKILAKGGGSDIYFSGLTLQVERVDFGTEELWLPSSMVDLDAKTLDRVNKEERQLASLFRKSREERLWAGAFVCPVEGELSGVFGMGRIINGHRRSPHTGVDLRAKEGAPVLACNGGEVVLVKPLFFSGKSVILDHGWGFYSMYFHLSEVLVKEGNRVGKGTHLGRVGSTGRSTGPHLHWGMRMSGTRVDPFSLLKLGQMW